LVDFEVGRPFQVADRLSAPYRAIQPFVEAVYWSLREVQIQAPFVKLVVSLRKDWVRDRSAFLLLNICEVTIPIDFEDVLRTQNSRRWAMDVSLSALDRVQENLDWDSREVRELLDRLGRHEGAYRFEPVRLSARGATRGTSYVTVIEFDEHGFRAFIEEKVGDKVLSSWPIDVPQGPVPYDHLYDSRAKVFGDHLVLQRRNGAIVAEVQVRVGPN